MTEKTQRGTFYRDAMDFDFPFYFLSEEHFIRTFYGIESY